MNIRCRTDKLEETMEFYRDFLCLKVGYRPNFDFPGYWMYAGDRPLVHISSRPPKGRHDGQPEDMDAGFGHVAFSATGLAQVKENLDLKGLKYYERATPDEGIYQLFVHDPNKVLVEFCFPIGERVD
ncbi:MAG: VOC family protein [Rhodospirillaceae bacterium]